MSIIKSDSGGPIFPSFQSPSVTDTTLTAVNSPLVINVAADLGGGTAGNRKGNKGWLENLSTVSITVEFAITGTSYQTAFTLRAAKNIDLTGMGLTSIRLTRTTGDAAFQAVIW